jgi:hypothetical protein
VGSIVSLRARVVLVTTFGEQLDFQTITTMDSILSSKIDAAARRDLVRMCQTIAPLRPPIVAPGSHR